MVIAGLVIEVVTGDAYIYSEWKSDPGDYFLIRSNIIYIVSPPKMNVAFVKYYLTNTSDLILFTKVDDSASKRYESTWYGYRNPIENDRLIKTSSTLFRLYAYFNYYTTESKYRP